jgi:hypothetical protein
MVAIAAVAVHPAAELLVTRARLHGTSAHFTVPDIPDA